MGRLTPYAGQAHPCPDDGAILEMTLWQVSLPVPGSAHRLKYSLFYDRPGDRVIGYDNERGKGDRRHVMGEEKA